MRAIDTGWASLPRDTGRKIPPALTDLRWFDGTQLYERAGEAPSAPAFDLAKGEVRSILLSNAAFWLDRYHVDAVRTISPAPRFWRACSRSTGTVSRACGCSSEKTQQRPRFPVGRSHASSPGGTTIRSLCWGCTRTGREWRPDRLAMRARSSSGRCCQAPSRCRCCRRSVRDYS